jgi:hypothetical protein
MPSIRPRHLRLARSAALAVTVVLALTAAWTARHPDRAAQPRESTAPSRPPGVPRPAPAVEAPAAVPAAAWRPVDEEPHHARPLRAPRPAADGMTLDRLDGDWVSWALLDRRTGNLTAGGDGWALAVLIRYPSGLGLGHGAEACRAVARKLAP